MPRNRGEARLRKPSELTRVTVTMDGALFNRINAAGQYNRRGLSGEIAYRLDESFLNASPIARFDLETMAAAMATAFQLGVVRWAQIQSAENAKRGLPQMELSAAVNDRACIIEGMVTALLNVWQNAPGDDRSNEALREAMFRRLPT